MTIRNYVQAAVVGSVSALVVVATVPAALGAQRVANIFDKGDVDGNGIVNAADARLALEYVVGVKKLSDVPAIQRSYIQHAMDVAGNKDPKTGAPMPDGRLNIRDVAVIAKMAAVTGDVNDDGVIDQQDVTLLTSLVNGEVKPVDFQQATGDLNKNGVLDQNDITLLEQQIKNQ